MLPVGFIYQAGYEYIDSKWKKVGKKIKYPTRVHELV